MAASPEPRRTVATPCREYGLAVGAEGHGSDLALMLQGWHDGLARGRVPEPRRLVVTPREYGLAVRAERHGDNCAPMLQGG